MLARTLLAREKELRGTERDPVIGWRHSTIVRSADGLRLGSRFHSGLTLAPGEPLVARCRVGRRPPCDCGCGIYGHLHSGSLGVGPCAMGWVKFRADAGVLRAFGLFAYYGRVRVRDDGLLRGHSARPVELWVADAETPDVAAAGLSEAYGIPTHALADSQLDEWRTDVAQGALRALRVADDDTLRST